MGRNRRWPLGWGFARGGTGALPNAIADAAREFGSRIRGKAGISKFWVKNGKPTA